MPSHTAVKYCSQGSQSKLLGAKGCALTMKQHCHKLSPQATPWVRDPGILSLPQPGILKYRQRRVDGRLHGISLFLS